MARTPPRKKTQPTVKQSPRFAGALLDAAAKASSSSSSEFEEEGEDSHLDRNDQGSTRANGHRNHHNIGAVLDGLSNQNLPEYLVFAPGKFEKFLYGGAPQWSEEAPLVKSAGGWNLHAIVTVCYLLRDAAVLNQQLREPKTRVPWRKFAQHMVSMNIVKFETIHKGGNHVKNLVKGLCQCQVKTHKLFPMHANTYYCLVVFCKP